MSGQDTSGSIASLSTPLQSGALGPLAPAKSAVEKIADYKNPATFTRLLAAETVIRGAA